MEMEISFEWKIFGINEWRGIIVASYFSQIFNFQYYFRFNSKGVGGPIQF